MKPNKALSRPASTGENLTGKYTQTGRLLPLTQTAEVRLMFYRKLYIAIIFLWFSQNLMAHQCAATHTLRTTDTIKNCPIIKTLLQSVTDAKNLQRLSLIRAAKSTQSILHSCWMFHGGLHFNTVIGGQDGFWSEREKNVSLFKIRQYFFHILSCCNTKYVSMNNICVL